MNRLKLFLSKLLSIKFVFAIVGTYFFYTRPGDDTLIVFLASWFLLVLGREAIKWIELWKK